jgi:ATP-dependent exoDNAse (exonuclease V) beta subunit
MNISDQIQRQESLDPKQSFIVQAPAGSGKTELLTQRYLRLLARANVPEDIIAITFTRKAAAEMRTRILEALQFAVDHPTPPQETHVAQRWQLANAVLEHNQTKNWNLLENPNRLRIQTIDSLCASLTRQMPVLSHFGATPDITDQPNAFYQMAAREVLAALETKHSWKSSLITLLLHLDNDHQKAEKLFCVMLAKRDQWLPYILEKKNQREVLETALQTIITETFSNLNLTLPSHLKNELFECLEFSLSNTGKVYSEKWLAIADLLLTKENQWRKNVDARNGFPAHEKIMKQRIKTLLEEISHDENFYQALVDLRAMPPANYRDSQWQILIALFELLPILVAHLQLIFQEHRILGS